jgi:hypothetical protein
MLARVVSLFGATAIFSCSGPMGLAVDHSSAESREIDCKRYARSCPATGDLNDCSGLAGCYHSGWSESQPDPKRALDLATSTCNRGGVFACHNASSWFQYELHDMSQAVGYGDRSCFSTAESAACTAPNQCAPATLADATRACEDLSTLYQMGQSGWPADPEKSRAAHGHACQLWAAQGYSGTSCASAAR